MVKPPSPRRQPDLTAFVLASVALHAVVLAYSHRVPAPLEAGMNRAALTVQLDGPAAPAAQHSMSPTRAPQSIQAMSAPAALVAIPAGSVPDDTAPEKTHDQDKDAASRVQAQVINDFARYFYYPALARRQGWEGRVLLAFRIEQDGLLRDPRVVRTSGIGILDEAALNSLRKVERVADAGDTPLDMQLPVVYQLKDTR